MLIFGVNLIETAFFKEKNIWKYFNNFFLVRKPPSVQNPTQSPLHALFIANFFKDVPWFDRILRWNFTEGEFQGSSGNQLQGGEKKYDLLDFCLGIHEIHLDMSEKDGHH